MHKDEEKVRAYDVFEKMESSEWNLLSLDASRILEIFGYLLADKHS